MGASIVERRPEPATGQLLSVTVSRRCHWQFSAGGHRVSITGGHRFRVAHRRLSAAGDQQADSATRADR